MSFAMYQDCLSPHQLPLARELVKRLGADNFRYVYRDKSQADRANLGWKMDEDEPWMVWMGDANDEWKRWVEECDVLYTGFREIELFERRAKKGLKTLYFSERWFKPVRVGIRDWGLGISLPGWVRMFSPGYRRMAKRMVAWLKADPGARYLAAGPWAKKDMMRLGVPEEKIVLWGYFVEPSTRLGVGEVGRSTKDVLKVLYVGRLLTLKRVDTIVRAVRELKKRKFHCTPTPRDYTLTIVGDGPEKERLVQLAQGLDNVFFKPSVPIDQVREVMRQHDVLVFASNGLDGWGAVVNEALEEDMRVLGTFETGASATMLPTSCLFHSGDWKELARKLSGDIPLVGIGQWTPAFAATRLLSTLNSQLSTPNRIPWLDRLKGILILLVVLGHVLGSAANVSTGTHERLLRGFFNVIYSFHMPAFFFLAGLTLKGFDFHKKFKRLLLPDFVFGVFSAIVYLALVPAARVGWWHPWASLVYGASFPGTDGFRCNSVLWFLPCLFLMTWLGAGLFRWLDGLRRPVAVACVLSFASAIAYVALNRAGCPALPYGGSLIFKYLPFVLLGHLLGVSRINWKLCFLALCVFCPAVVFAPSEWSVYFTYWKWLLSVGVAIAGTLACCYVALIWKWRVLVWFGEASIGVMLIHKWCVLGCNRLFGFYDVIAVFLIASVLSLLLTWLVRRWCPKAVAA